LQFKEIEEGKIFAVVTVTVSPPREPIEEGTTERAAGQVLD
jgi:hypothetical protein